MSELKFYRCAHCGNVIEKLVDSGVPVVCCGEPMKELVPASVDASHEKHVPVVSVSDGVVSVEVGAAAHPMIDVHYIQWIVLETSKGAQRRSLAPGQAPKAVFVLGEGEEPVAVYAYCNIHGLWKTAL